MLRRADKIIDARAGMQLGACLAGLAIENSMLGAAHALANPLTAHYGLVHGQAIGTDAAARDSLQRRPKLTIGTKTCWSPLDWQTGNRVAGQGAAGLADFVTSLLAAAGLSTQLRGCAGRTRQSFPSWLPTLPNNGLADLTRAASTKTRCSNSTTMRFKLAL